jgi:hypothetical protein
MGLLKQGFKYGGLAYAARSIGKGVAAREESKVAAAAAAATPTTSAPADGQYQQQRGEARELPAYDAMNNNSDQVLTRVRIHYAVHAAWAWGSR